MGQPRNKPFSGKSAIIVGASSGIGKALALELAAQGAKLHLAGRKLAALEEVAAASLALGSEAKVHVLDVTSASAVGDLANEVASQEGRIDYFFNMAGDALLALTEETTLDHWKYMLDVNLMGVVHGLHAVYPIMKRQGHGHIVNCSSLAGLIPLPSSAAYCAAKYGAVGASLALRVEAAEFGVNVSIVCPAAVKTGLDTRALYIGYDQERFSARPPPGGMLEPGDCAIAILKGVRSNRAVIAPGAASIVWRVARWFPAAWERAARSFAQHLGTIRTSPKPAAIAGPDATGR